MLAKRVIDERERLGLKPAELARKARISQPSLWAIENGVTKAETIKATTLFQLADIFVCNPYWLLYEKGPREATTGPLSPEAVAVAKDWQTLTLEVRGDLARTLRALAQETAKYGPAVPDARVAAAYGAAPKFSRSTARKTTR